MNKSLLRLVLANMRLVTLGLAFASVFAFLPRAYAGDNEQIIIDRDSMRHQLEALLAHVELATRALGGDKPDAKRANGELVDLKDELGELLRKINAAKSVDSVGQIGAKAGTAVVTSAVYVSPIGDASLRIVLERMNKEALPDGKLRVLKDATANTFFVADQCLKVLGTFANVDDRIRALELLMPRLLDRQNAPRILFAFPFAAEKERAKSTMARVFATAPAPVPTTSP